jgi:hypothetical protein
VARLEAGLPICGHKDCTIPFDAPNSEGGCDDANQDRDKRVTEKDVAEVIRRAEDEVFALLKANWPVVKRVVNALCKQDRLTAIELEDLIAESPR